MPITLDGTTGIDAPLGTAATPSYGNTTAATTGLYFPTSTTLGLSTNGTAALTIDASQNVGIGTTSPAKKLHVNGDIRLGDGGGTGAIFTDATNGLRFMLPAAGTSNTESMRIDSSGNVGIGTSSPSTYGKLAVSTPTAGYGFLSVNNSAGGGGGGQLSYYYSTAKVAYVDSAVSNGTPGSETASLAFATANSGTIAERMRIDSSGNVGIGTTSPLGKLKVTVGDNAPSASGNMTTGVVIEAGSTSRAINIGVNNTAGYSWINAAYANNSGVADNLVLMTGTTERMRITSAGGVSFGSSGTAYGTSGQVLTSAGNAPPTWGAVPSSATLTQYTSGSGTWTRPSTGTFCLVRCWGGGGSGGHGGSTSGQGAGGGGGAYAERFYILANMPSTASYSVAAGGAAVTAQGFGNAGGTTTFATGTDRVAAYGGGAGPGNGNPYSGGSGGSIFATGTVNGTPTNWWDGAQGGSVNGGVSGPGNYAYYGGGGGGGGAGTGSAGGTSYGGGPGGAGSSGSASATAGTQPAGGGGGCATSSASFASGKGGDGKIEIWVW